MIQSRNNTVLKKLDMSLIDDRASIDPSAKIADGVRIGPWCYIGPNVEIDEGTELYSHVVISRDTQIGKNNIIYPFATLGGDPQDLSYRGQDTFLKMGDGNIVREYVTINRGSSGGKGATEIGDKNCFLAYSHVAHDCKIGNEVLFVNNATIAGHVQIDDYASIGAFCAIHQYCRIGAYSFLSGGAMVSHDIPPYMLVVGVRGGPIALNKVGLKRRGFSDDAIRGLKRAFSVMYRQGLKLNEVREELVKLSAETPEINLILELLDNSKRGVIRKSSFER